MKTKLGLLFTLTLTLSVCSCSYEGTEANARPPDTEQTVGDTAPLQTSLQQVFTIATHAPVFELAAVQVTSQPVAFPAYLGGEHAKAWPVMRDPDDWRPWRWRS